MTKPGYKRLPTRCQYGTILPEQALDEDVVGQEQVVRDQEQAVVDQEQAVEGQEQAVVGHEQVIGGQDQIVVNQRIVEDHDYGVVGG